MSLSQRMKTIGEKLSGMKERIRIIEKVICNSSFKLPDHQKRKVERARARAGYAIYVKDDDGWKKIRNNVASQRKVGELLKISQPVVSRLINNQPTTVSDKYRVASIRALQDKRLKERKEKSDRFFERLRECSFDNDNSAYKFYLETMEGNATIF